MPQENDVAVRNNTAASRFEITVGDQVAVLTYDRTGGDVKILHTEVPRALGGRGLATLLAKTALEWARAEHLSVVVLCPFVREYMRKHPMPPPDQNPAGFTG
jgi:predicted GNAT family acetyltransferase